MPETPTITFDHAAIAAPEKAPITAFMLDLLGGTVLWDDQRGLMPANDQGFRAVQIDYQGTTVEIIEPTGPESFLLRFLETRGPGLHHITYKATELESLLEKVKGLGLRLHGIERRNGQVINSFIHPASTFGVLVQFRPKFNIMGPRWQDHVSRKDLPAPRPALVKLDHVTNVTPDAAKSAGLFAGVLDAEATPPRPFRDFTLTHVRGHDPFLAFAQPRDEAGEIAKFIRRRGPGMHHLSFSTDDLEGIERAARALGVRIVPGANPDEKWLHPSNPTGALMRLQRKA